MPIYTIRTSGRVRYTRVYEGVEADNEDHARDRLYDGSLANTSEDIDWENDDGEDIDEVELTDGEEPDEEDDDMPWRDQSPPVPPSQPQPPVEEEYGSW